MSGVLILPNRMPQRSVAQLETVIEAATRTNSPPFLDKSWSEFRSMQVCIS
jgi:hypothetical protein